MQINHITKNEYSGDNANFLQNVQNKNDGFLNEWLTFVQAKNAGLKIKKGAKGFRILRVIETEDEKTKRMKTSIKSFVVFNLSQTE